MMKKIAIVYLSFGGNTKSLSLKIASLLEEGGHQVHLFNNRENVDLSSYDYILFGSLTWEINGKQGKLPIPMRKYLKKILIDNPQDIKRVSLFGTGETQWGIENYCKAVDEMEYHFTKHDIKIDYKLKIEQSPIGKENQILEYTRKILEVI